MIGIELFKCIEDHAYSTKETSNKRFKVQTFFLTTWYGLVDHVEISPGVITMDLVSSLRIPLSPNISHEIRIMDPTLQIFTTSPETIPRTLLKLEGTFGYVYLKVKWKLTSLKSFRLRDLLIWLPLITFPYLSLPFLTFPYLSLPFLALLGLTGAYRAFA